MRQVRVVSGVTSLGTKKSDDFVFSLAGTAARGEQDRQVLEQRRGRIVDTLLKLTFQVARQRRHKGCAWRDLVRVPTCWLAALCALLRCVRRFVPSASLLIHLRSRGDTIDGEIEEAGGTNKRDNENDILLDQAEALVIRELRIFCFALVCMRAGVDDSVEIKVQVIEVSIDRFFFGIVIVHNFG